MASCPSEPSVASAPKRKSLRTAYLLWLFMPASHLIYLERDAHALLHIALFGGFGLGWLRDGFSMRRYVCTANGDTALVTSWQKELTRSAVPHFSAFRTAAMLLAGWIGAAALSSLPPPAASLEGATPEQRAALVVLEGALAALGAALGAHTAGALPPLQGPLSTPLLAAALAALCLHARRRYRLDHSEFEEEESDAGFHGAGWCALAAALAFRWSASYQLPLPEPASASEQPSERSAQSSAAAPRRGLARRLLRLWVGLVAVYTVVGSALVQRGEIQVGEETVHLREAAYNMWRSPVWVEMRTSAHKWLLEELPQKGFAHVWQELREAMDFTGEKHACRVLGVELGAGRSAVKKAYLAAVLEHHPDKQQAGASEEEKAAAQEKFREVQAAYETLQGLRKIQREREADGE